MRAIGETWNTPAGPMIMTDLGPRPCDGQLVSRKQMPALYAAIGAQYCDEDARCCTSELFNLPG